jgi:hypothetical protein
MGRCRVSGINASGVGDGGVVIVGRRFFPAAASHAHFEKVTIWYFGARRDLFERRAIYDQSLWRVSFIVITAKERFASSQTRRHRARTDSVIKRRINLALVAALSVAPEAK